MNFLKGVLGFGGKDEKEDEKKKEEEEKKKDEERKKLLKKIEEQKENRLKAVQNIINASQNVIQRMKIGEPLTPEQKEDVEQGLQLLDEAEILHFQRLQNIVDEPAEEKKGGPKPEDIITTDLTGDLDAARRQFAGHTPPASVRGRGVYRGRGRGRGDLRAEMEQRGSIIFTPPPPQLLSPPENFLSPEELKQAPHPQSPILGPAPAIPVGPITSAIMQMDGPQQIARFDSASPPVYPNFFGKIEESKSPPPMPFHHPTPPPLDFSKGRPSEVPSGRRTTIVTTSSLPQSPLRGKEGISPQIQARNLLARKPLTDANLRQKLTQEMIATGKRLRYEGAMDTSITTISPGSRKPVSGHILNVTFPPSDLTSESFHTVTTLPSPKRLDESFASMSSAASLPPLPPMSSVIGAPSLPQSAIFAPPGMQNAPLFPGPQQGQGKLERSRLSSIDESKQLAAKRRSSLSLSMQEKINAFTQASPDRNRDKEQIEHLAKKAVEKVMKKKSEQPEDWDEEKRDFLPSSDRGTPSDGGNPPSSEPSTVSSIAPRMRPPNVLTLPSLQRAQFQVPTGVDITIAATKITPEEEAAYRNNLVDEINNQRLNYENEVEALGQAFERLAAHQKLIPSQEQVFNTISPRDIHRFVIDDTLYNKVLNRTSTIAVEEQLNPAVHEFMPTPNANDRIDQLANIFRYMNGANRLHDLEMLFASGSKNLELRANFAENEIDSILIRERFYNQNPANIAKEMLEDPAFNWSAGQIKALNEILNNAESDNVLREHGHLTDEEYQNRNNYYQASLLELGSQIDADLGAESFMKNRSKINLKASTDWNILMNRLDQIGRLVRSAPQLPISQNLAHRMNDVIGKLKDHRYDLREAYGQINGIYNILKPVIDSPQEYAQSNLEFGDVIPEVEEKKEIFAPNMPSFEPVQQGDEEFFHNKMQEMRDDSKIFAFPNIAVRQTSKNPLGVPMGWGTALISRDIDIAKAYNAMENINKIQIQEYATQPVTMGNLHELDEKALEMGYNIDQLKLMLNTMIHILDDKKVQRIFRFSTKFYPNPLFSGQVSNDPGDYARAIHYLSGQLREAQDFFGRIEKDYHGNDVFVPSKLPFFDVTRAKDLRKMVKQVGAGPRKHIISTKKKNVAYILPVVPPSRINPPKKPTEIDVEKPMVERNRLAEMRTKKFAQNNFKFAKKISKETPEINRAEYGKNIIEFDVQSDADLMRMKTEVSKMKGRLYIIDLRTGRLFPITYDKAFVGQNYIFIRDSEDSEKKNDMTGGGFGAAIAYYPALHAAMRDSEHLLPQEFMRNGNDKAPQMIHQLHKVPYFNDYRDQVRKERGAGLWKATKKILGQAAKETGNYVIKKTSEAGQQLVKDTIHEGKNFYNKQKRNVAYIGNANKQFYSNPSFGGLNRAINRTVVGSARLLTQPVVSGARETVAFSNAVDKIPGLNVAKMAGEYFIPPLAVADALTKGIKNVDEGRYYDAAINAGDALLGSGKLNGAVDLGAKTLTTGLKLGDKIIDKEQHK